MSIDESKKVFDELHQQWVANKDSIETEQDTRLQIIDRMLIEVLGWHRIDIRTEPSVDSGYVDYLLQSDHRNRFVVEAKKADRLLVDTRNPRCNSYKANGPALESARQGLNQARRYCGDTGVIFSALTSGFEWIAYWAVRTDGVPPGDGKAIVFPNLDSINDNFALFYDLFSKNGVLNNLFQIRIHEAEGLKVRHAEALESVFGENDIRLLHRSDLASDLEIIFRQFFSTMNRPGF